MNAPIVTVKCVGCGAIKTLPADAPMPDGVPMCDVCMMPMATVKVSARAYAGALNTERQSVKARR